jgi:hypothetical protein
MRGSTIPQRGQRMPPHIGAGRRQVPSAGRARGLARMVVRLRFKIEAGVVPNAARAPHVAVPQQVTGRGPGGGTKLSPGERGVGAAGGRGRRGGPGLAVGEASAPNNYRST